jgi:hypothetical protein
LQADGITSCARQSGLVRGVADAEHRRTRRINSSGLPRAQRPVKDKQQLRLGGESEYPPRSEAGSRLLRSGWLLGEQAVAVDDGRGEVDELAVVDP